MVKDINNLGASINSTLRKTGGEAKTTGNSSAGQASASPAASSDEGVQLSNEAKALRNAEATVAQQPEVDEQKVQAIKAALESGEYRVNDLVVADKLLQIDTLFG